jgi:hypothetical protein
MTAETDSVTCPWCSASVPVAASTCPSCGAALRDASSSDIAGVTQIDPSAVLRTKRIKRSGLAAWLVGEREEDEPSIGKVEPPSEEVRREMLRLELAAIDAELDAKAAAAEANRELGIDAEAPATTAEAQAGAAPAAPAAPEAAAETPDLQATPDPDQPA